MRLLLTRGNQHGSGNGLARVENGANISRSGDWRLTAGNARRRENSLHERSSCGAVILAKIRIRRRQRFATLIGPLVPPAAASGEKPEV